MRLSWRAAAAVILREERGILLLAFEAAEAALMHMGAEIVDSSGDVWEPVIHVRKPAVVDQDSHRHGEGWDSHCEHRCCVGDHFFAAPSSRQRGAGIAPTF